MLVNDIIKQIIDIILNYKSNIMALTDRNFQFLLKCKNYDHQNRLKQLIISQKDMTDNSQLTHQQILVSQYVSALHDEIINPNHFKQGQHYSLQICFALMQKALKQQNLELVDYIISVSLKEQSITSKKSKNRHILIYNKTKILQMLGNIKNAAFYCERLLKQSGQGLDYYTSQFLLLLIRLGRNQEALKIAERHLKNSNTLQKQIHKIQSVYIYLLHQIYEKDQLYVLKSIQQNFSNKNICLRNWYNLALLLKYRHPIKSLQIFKKILSHKNIQKLPKLQYLTKINIIYIYQQYYLKNIKINEINNKNQIKQILEQLQNIYLQMEIKYQQKWVDESYNKVTHLIKDINQQIKNQKNLHFYQSINSKSYKQAKSFKKLEEEFNAIQANKIKEENKPKETSQFKYFKQKRAEHQKKLKFLLKKQKQLKQFFNKIQVQRKGNQLNIKVLDQTLLNKTQTKSIKIQNELKDFYQTKYQQKKSKFQTIYEKDQINTIINNYIDRWVLPHQAQHIKFKNEQRIKNFVIQLDAPQEITERQINTPQIQTSKSIKNIRSNRSSQQAFRVKNNTSRRPSDKMLEGLKYNDFISNQIVNHLKINMNDKHKQEKGNKGKKNFKQLLHQGELFDSENKLQEAHEIYAKMYKWFKEDQQKQILLLKIAQNYEKMSFIFEAQKTYIKCSKFNNSQAFFKLGSLQIRNGKIQMGIQNLEKANCIERNNTKIQIQLVYAYSLLQQTTERALALANSILKRDPQSLQALVMLSKILQKKGKIKQALDIAIAISNTLGTASTYHFIGLLYLNDSNVVEAFKYFQKALECDPCHSPSLIELATITSEENAQQAIQILKNVLSSDPSNQLAFARLGKIYQTFQNDYQNALMIYKKGLEYSPTYQNHIKIGDCHFKLGYVMEAYLSYKQALALKRTAQIFQKIAQVHEYLHQDKKAVEVYASALAELPKDNSSFSKQKKYLFKLGKLSLLSQQYQTAYGYLLELTELQQNFEIFKLLGQASFGKNDFKQALRYYSLASAAEPQDNIQLLENIAMCLDKQQQYIASKQIYEKILSIDPKNVKCLNNLANILLILGKTNQAFYWFQFMLQQSPNSIDKRLRVSDIYATIGDWSKVQQHLMVCYKQKQNDIRVIQRLVNLYKEKRDTKQLTKFQKRLALLKSNAGKSN